MTYILKQLFSTLKTVNNTIHGTSQVSPDGSTVRVRNQKKISSQIKKIKPREIIKHTSKN